MKGYIQIMQDIFSTTDDTIAVELINKLNLQIDRLSNLIRDLLDITRIRQGLLEFKKTNFNIDFLINEVVTEMQFGSKNHIIIADLKAATSIKADRERIRQVLGNLISNAIKYSPDEKKLIITSSANEENITISVQDFGIGISRDMQEKIFDRFFRYHDKVHMFPGLGLGLYIASEIVKHHNGSLSVKSTPA